MPTATLSSKFQLAIPVAVRSALNLRPGQRFRIVPYHDRVELIPVRTAEEIRGFLQGMDTHIERDQDRL